MRSANTAPGHARVFCSCRGNSIYSACDDRLDVKRLCLCTVDAPFLCVTIFRIHDGSKAPWPDVTDVHSEYAAARPEKAGGGIPLQESKR